MTEENQKQQIRKDISLVQYTIELPEYQTWIIETVENIERKKKWEISIVSKTDIQE